jgi:hypothetical protein
MRTNQAELAAAAADAGRRDRHALAAWETDGGASPEPAARAADGGQDDQVLRTAVWANPADESEPPLVGHAAEVHQMNQPRPRGQQEGDDA